MRLQQQPARGLDRLYFAAASLLSLTFLVAALYSARHISFVPPDAASYGVVARSLLRGEGYTEPLVAFHPGTYESVRHVPELHGLLRPIVLVPLFALLGIGPFALHVPSLSYMALIGVVVFWWGRRVFGREAGLLACALTLLNVNLLLYSLMGTDDTGFAFYFLCALAVLHVALTEERRRYFLLAGCLGGLALLEKPSGFFISAVFLAPLLKLGGKTLRQVARWLALLFAPFLAAVGVYLLRNYLAYGSPQFRFGVLVWIWKRDGYEGWAQLFDGVPPLLGMLQQIGLGGVVELTWVELRRFLDILIPLRVLVRGTLLSAAVPALMPGLALVAALLGMRRMPEMAWLFLSSLVASAAFCAVLYTAQMRYFAWLVPLSALWVSGVLVGGMRSGPGRWWGWVVRAGCAAVAAWLVVASATTLLATQRAMRPVPKAAMCRDALDWIAKTTGPRERILTFDPWLASWVADREAIMIPSGGIEPILVVARRYDAHWLLASRSSLRPHTSKLVMELEGRAAGLRVRREFDDGICRVYRLDWPRRVSDARRPGGFRGAASRNRRVGQVGPHMTIAAAPPLVAW